MRRNDFLDLYRYLKRCKMAMLNRRGNVDVNTGITADASAGAAASAGADASTSIDASANVGADIPAGARVEANVGAGASIITDAGDIKILVAAHKPYWMPSDPMYVPVHVGSVLADEVAPGFQRDDEGDNISAENPRYCELTALYWAWKNLDAEYLGLAHYRRHFAGNGERGVLSAEEARELLAKAPVVLPKPRNYFHITTVEKHYGDTFDPLHIECLRMALEMLYPEYVDVFNKHMASSKIHLYNMFIMRRDIYDAYLSWMFEVLRAAEAGIEYDGLTPFEARVMGRISERLLDTWLEVNGVQYVECPLVSMEKVRWDKKIVGALTAKFAGKKYTASF